MSYSKSKFDTYLTLTENYIDLINELINYSLNKNLLPLKYLIAIPIIKNYIDNNKSKIIEYGVTYILEYKNEILNFSLSSLDNNIYDDNNINNIYQLKNIINNEQQGEILNIIIEIKNNAHKLNIEDMNIIKSYIELLIMILEKLKYLFCN